MTKVSCLKRILAALSGQSVESIQGTTVCEIIHSMASLIHPIPTATSQLTNDANFTTKFIVNVTGDTSSATSDKTLAEIYAAHQAGKVIECHYSAFALHPLMISDSVCSFSCDVMSTGTTCQRTTINITAQGAGIAVLNYVMTPAA